MIEIPESVKKIHEDYYYYYYNFICDFISFICFLSRYIAENLDFQNKNFVLEINDKKDQ